MQVGTEGYILKSAAFVVRYKITYANANRAPRLTQAWLLPLFFAVYGLISMSVAFA